MKTSSLTLIIGLFIALLSSQAALAERADSRELLLEGEIYSVQGDGVNVRSSDQITNNIMGQLQRGDRVRVLDSSTNYNGDFVQIEVVASRYELRQTEKYFMSFRFLSACPMDWRQALCASQDRPTRIFQVDTIEQFDDHRVTFTNPRIILQMQSYGISNTSRGLDVCQMMGMQNLEQGILYVSNRGYRSNLVLTNDQGFDVLESLTVSGVRCIERTDAQTRTPDESRALIIYEDGDFDDSFFELRGVELHQIY